MKRLLIILTLLLVTAISVYTTEKTQPHRLIYHSDVTMEQFKQVCKKENVTSDLSKWLEFSVAFNNEKEVIQWLYVKGKNADTLFTLTKRPEHDHYKLDIQVREKEPKK